MNSNRYSALQFLKDESQVIPLSTKDKKKQARAALSVPMQLFHAYKDAGMHVPDYIKSKVVTEINAKVEETKPQVIKTEEAVVPTLQNHVSRTARKKISHAIVDEKEPTQEKSEWKTAKWTPVAPQIKALDTDERVEAIRVERKKNNDAITQEIKNTDTRAHHTAIPKTAFQGEKLYVDKYTRRKHNKRFALARMATRDNQLSVRENLELADKGTMRTDLSDPHLELNLNERIRLRNRRHTCEHGLKFNRVYFSPVDEDSYKFSCFHSTAIQVGPEMYNTEYPCLTCHAYISALYRNTCKCEYFLCSRCKTSSFYYGPCNKQIYDKHSAYLNKFIVTTTEMVPYRKVYDETLTPVPVKEEMLITTNKLTNSRNAFLTSFKPGATQRNLAQVLQSHNIRYSGLKHPIYKPFKIPVVQSTPEGGAVSTVKATGESAWQGIRDYFKSNLDEINGKIKKIKLVKSVAENPLIKRLLQLLRSIKYILSIFLDYMDLTMCGLLLQAIYNFRTYGFKSQAILSIAMMITHMRTMEARDINRIKNRSENWGCLKTIFTRACKEHGNVKALRDINNMPLSSLAGDFQEAGHGEAFMAVFSGFCSRLPRKFAGASKDLAYLAKDILPSLMLFNATARAASTISSIVNKVIQYFFVSTRSPRDWIAYHLNHDGNPLYEMHVSYLVYKAVILESKVNKTKQEPSELRSDFYRRRTLAEAFVSEQGMYCSEIQWLFRSYEHGMQETPFPTEREFEPTVLGLYGGAGTGKSTVWPLIISHAHPGLSASQLHQKTFTWDTRSDYTVGVSKAHNILFDDLGQDKEGKEALEVIRLTTCAPYPINAAAIVGEEVKGMFANPKTLVICTNDVDFGASQVFSQEANTRRYDLILDMKKKFDPEDLDKEIFTVKSCPLYPKLEATNIGVSTATLIFGLIDKRKKTTFTQLKEDLSQVYERLQDTRHYLINNKNDLPRVSEAWKKLDSNIVADLDKYVDERSSLGGPSQSQTIADRQDAEAHLARLEALKKKENDEEVLEKIETDMKHYEAKHRVACFTLERLAQKQQALKDSKLTPKAITSKGEDLDKISIYESDSEAFEPYMIYFKNSLAFSGWAASNVYVLAALTQLYHRVRAEGFNLFSYEGSRQLLNSVLKVVFGSLASLTSVYLIYRYLYPDEEESGTSQTSKRHNKTVAVTNIPSARQSGPADTPDPLYPIIAQATGVLQREDGVRVNCLFVGGRYILTVAHFFEDFSADGRMYQRGKTLYIQKNMWGVMKREIFEPSRLRYFSKPASIDGMDIRNDIILYELDSKKFNEEKNIVKFFWSGTHSVLNRSVTKVDFQPSPGESNDIIPQHEIACYSGVVTVDRCLSRRINGTDAYYHLAANATYQSRQASCGSAIYMTPNNSTERILGVHIAAAYEGGSLFHFVTQQELTACMNQTLDFQESGVVFHPDMKMPAYMPEKHGLEFIGRIEKPIFLNTKTTLSPSLTYGALGPVLTEPAALTFRDQRLPYNNKLLFEKSLFAGYSLVGTFEPEEIARATASLIEDDNAFQRTSIVIPKILTLDEALNGLPEYSGSSRIPMDTSCGYPYNTIGMSKKDLIFEAENRLYPRDRLCEDYTRAMACLRLGTVPFLPFEFTLKDERVKCRKVRETPKTRLFANGNIVRFLIMRTYFHTTMLSYYHGKRDNYFTMGLDRLSLDWHELISYLTEVGVRGFDGDYSNWDKSISGVLLGACFDIMINPVRKYMADQELAALKQMYVGAYAIYGADVYRSFGCMFSGDLTTYFGNCILNQILSISAYLSLTRTIPLFNSVKAFKKHVRNKHGGDDTIKVVHEAVADIFNGVTYGNYINSHGMMFTSADKTDQIVELQSYEDLSFLKNCTRVSRGYYVPLPEAGSLSEMTNYVRLSKENNDILKATEDNVNAALRGYYFHGSKEFNRVRDTLLRHEPRLNLFTFLDLKGVWGKYLYFPGSHSDYSTRKDQIEEYDLGATVKVLRTYPTPVLSIDTINMDLYEDHTNNTEKILKLTSEESAEARSRAKPFPVLTHIYEAGIDQVAENMKDDVKPELATTKEGTPAMENPDVEPAGVDQKVQQVLGTTVATSEKPIQATLTTGGKPVHAKAVRAFGHVNDDDWTLSKLAQKYTMLGNYSWDTSMAAGTVIKSWILPNDVLSTPALQTPFSVTELWRADAILFKINVVSSSFYSGRLGLVFFPTFNSVVPTDVLNRGIQLGMVQINPADAQTIEYRVPYVHYLAMLEYPKDVLGSFNVVVVSPLATGAGNEAAVTINAFVALENSSFKIPEYVPAAAKPYKFQLPVVPSLPEANTPQPNTRIQIIESTSESGVEIARKISQQTINDPVDKLDTIMLCAGPGFIVEPKIHHFADHPLDLIELYKRYHEIQTFTGVLEPAPSLGELSSLMFSIELNAYMRAMPIISQIYKLWRGGLNFKIVMQVFNEAGANVDLDAQVFLTNGTIESTMNPSSLEAEGRFVSGSHHFNCMHPAEFTVPYLNYTFASTFYDLDAPLPGRAVQTQNLYVYIPNWNTISKYSVIVTVYMALGDDFSAGVFIGTPHIAPPTLVASRPEAGNIIEDVSRAIENIVPVVQGISELGALLDSDPICYQPEPQKIRKMGYTLATNQVQFVERMGQVTLNGNNLTDAEAYGKSRKETDMYDLMRNVKTLVTSNLNWDQSMPTDTMLFSDKVGPLCDNMYASNPPPMDYFAKDFQFWNGSVIYIFDVVATAMHEGRLTFTFHPNLLAPPAHLVDATQQYFTSVDLKNGRCFFAVSVPYLCKTPYRPVANYLANPEFVSPFDQSDVSSGVVALWVQNKLRSTQTVASSVKINIYRVAGPDFKLDGYACSWNGHLNRF